MKETKGEKEGGRVGERQRNEVRELRKREGEREGGGRKGEEGKTEGDGNKANSPKINNRCR